MFLSRCFTTIWCIYVDVFKMHWKILGAWSQWSRPGLLSIMQKKITYSVKLWRGCWKFTASLNWCINVAWACTSCLTKREGVSSPYRGMQLQKCLLFPALDTCLKRVRRLHLWRLFYFCCPLPEVLQWKIVLKLFMAGLGQHCCILVFARMVPKPWKETTVLWNPTSWKRCWRGTMISEVILEGVRGGTLPNRLIKVLHEAIKVVNFIWNYPAAHLLCHFKNRSSTSAAFDTELWWLLLSKYTNHLFAVKQGFLLPACDSALALWFTTHYWFAANSSAGQDIASPCSFHCSHWSGEFQPAGRLEQQGWKPLL